MSQGPEDSTAPAVGQAIRLPDDFDNLRRLFDSDDATETHLRRPLGISPVRHANTVRFRPNDVESLLDQASGLLERAIGERAEYEALGEKYFRAKVELRE
jgi:hypothetical protein